MTKTIELLNGERMPVFGIGTWQLRGQECISAVKEALDMGYEHIDTADAYENHAQIRQALQGFEREKLFITTKIPKEHLDQPVRNVERYLDELGLEYLDLVLLHWPKRGAPMAASLLEIQEMEQVKSIGVSNFSIDLIEGVLAQGFKPVNNQVEFHPYHYQQELLAYCQQNEIVLTAYSPLARGEVINDPVLSKIGKKHNASAVQVALAWVLAKQAVAIPKASSRDHLQANLEAMKIELSAAEIAEIDTLDQG